MTGAARLLQHITAAAFLPLAGLAVRDWRRHRDDRHASLAGALGLLGACVAIGQINEWSGHRYHVLSIVSSALFLGSGYALLLFRHTFMPLSRRVRMVVLALTIGGAFIPVIVRLPDKPQPSYTLGQLLPIALLFAVWTMCVLEPIVRFWVAARGRPAVQRARLRCLSLAYGGIVMIFVVALAAAPTGQHAWLILGTNLFSLIIIPLLYVGLTAPSFMRRMWRTRQDEDFRTAVHSLMLFSNDRTDLARRALAWAVAIVGGDGGAIVDATGEVLATSGMATDEVTALADQAREHPGLLRVVGADGQCQWVIGVAMQFHVGQGMLVVRAGPFTPIFGADESSVLDHYAATVTTALDRVRMSEQLAEQTALREKLLQAMSDLGQGFVITDGNRILYANDALTAMSGYSLAELQALPSYRQIISELHTQPERRGTGNASEVPPEHHHEFVLHRADGRQVDVESATKLLGTQAITVLRDVTARKRADATLRQSEERFRLLVDGVQDYAIYMLDETGSVVSWNLGAERIYSWTAAEAIGLEHGLFYLDDETRAGVPNDQLRLAAVRGHIEAEGWRIRKDGSCFFASVIVTALPADNGDQRGFAVVVRDVTEQRAADAALAHQAMHDDLTGLANRTLFLDRLEMCLGRLDRSGMTAAVLFIDLDHFKTINDSLGHPAGDRVLVGAAERLAAAVRPGDTVARFGGDEFVVVCDNVSGIRHVVAIAERLAELLAAPYALDHDQVGVSASIGIAVANGAGDLAESLLRDADAALYRAKELGRNRIEVFDDALRARAVERLETENGLRRAIERGELRVLYQPEVTVADGEIVGVEALVRWQHPTLGLVLPAQFVPIAEESGLIIPVGNWVISEACRQARLWSQARPDSPPLTVSINLSARQLSQADLVRTVSTALTETGTDPTTVCLEITESVLMDDVDATMRTLRALKDLGVQLAVDDFGTGYSSLSYLKRFPVDILKIDQSFVAGVGDDPEDSAIVAAVTKLGHTLGLTVVAEGVETETQALALRRLRCDLAQGRFFAPPLAPELIGAYLGDRRLVVAR